MIKLDVYGKEGCPWCQKAKEALVTLKNNGYINEGVYHDYIKEGITTQELSDMAGEPITAVPVVFKNNEFLGVGFDCIKNCFPGAF